MQTVLPLWGMLGVLALASLLSGCLLQEEKPDASLDIPDHYVFALPGGGSPASDWWTAFRSSEVNRLAQVTRAANLDLGAAIARINQAVAQEKVAGSTLFPALDGSGNAQRSRSSSFGSHTFQPLKNTFSNSLSASYEIDFWGKNAATLSAAQSTTSASRYDAKTVEISALASTLNAYFQILAARERARITGENLASASRILKLINERVAAGTASALDQAQQETTVANLRANIPPLQEQIAQTSASLAVLLGMAPERLESVQGSLMQIALPRISPGLPADLLLQRPDIAYAEAQLAAAQANVLVARAAFYPSITLTGQGGFESLALKSLFIPQSGFFSLASGLAQPIFEGFRLEGQLEEQKARQEELLQNYRKSVLSAFSDTEKALASMRYLAAQETLVRAAVASSRRAYEISETRLREGTVDLVTVLNTEQSLFTAQDSLVQVRLARLQAAVSLFQALGGGWHRSGGTPS